MTKVGERITKFRDIGRSPWWRVAIFVLMGGILVLDTQTPLGFSHGMLYSPIIILAALSFSFTVLSVTALFSVAFVFIGTYLSPSAPFDFSFYYIWANRAMAAAVIIIIWWLSHIFLRYLIHVQAVRVLFKQSRSQLKDKLKLLKVAGEVAKFGGWSLSLVDYTVRWSDEVAEILELPRGSSPTMNEAIGFFVPEHRQHVQKTIQVCSQEGIEFDEEWQAQTRGGRKLWVRLIGRPLYDAQSGLVGVFGAVQEVSRYKDVEFNLVLSQQRFKQLADAMPIIVWTSKPNGELDYLNREITEITGRTLDELLEPEGWLSILHPEDRSEAMERWINALNHNDEPYQNEFRVLHADGNYHWYLAQGTAIRNSIGEVTKWYGSAIDVQTQKQIQEEYRELANRFERTLESLPDAFVIMQCNWEMTFINKHALTLMGGNINELIGMEIWDAMPELKTSAIRERLQEAAQTRAPQNFVCHVKAKNKWLSIGFFFVSNRLNLIVRDVTEQNLLEIKLRNAQRMEAVGQLTGGVAHDFNNLLTVIQGNANILAEEMSEHINLIPLVKMIEQAAEKGSKLTYQLLAFAKKQILVPVATDINLLLRESKLLIGKTLGEHIQLKFDLDENIDRVLVDPIQLESVILNLIINARDAMPKGGAVIVRTSEVERQKAILPEIRTLQADHFALIEVRDTGIGIPPENIGQVFEPFFTTKGLNKGTGLGLSMAFGFATQSGGHAAIQSELNSGTSVSVYLPLASEQTPNDHITAIHNDPVKEESAVILIAEDDILVREFAAAQLSNAGYKVIVAGNGQEALHLLNEEKQIDLLFSDLIMPGGMSGLELAQEAIKIKPKLKVILTTGYAEGLTPIPKPIQNIPIINKPFRRVELLAKIKELLQIQPKH